MAASFDPDDFELRWPPRLFVDEANRLLGRKGSKGWISDVEWLLTEAFISTEVSEAFSCLPVGQWGKPRTYYTEHEQWLSRVIREAATWPAPDTRKRYWSARAGRRTGLARMAFDQLTRRFVQLIEEFEASGYLAQAFGQACVDDRDGPPLPDRAIILEERAGYPVAHWPLEETRAGWEIDDFCDLIEVFHDLVSRPSSRWYHSDAGCGWHYSAFAAGPGRRLYRWQVNRLLAAGTLGLQLAEDGEDLGRLVRVQPRA